MSRWFVGLVCAVSLSATAAETPPEKKAVKDAELGKKETSATPDKSLAGDVTRKKKKESEIAPALQYDQFRLEVESQTEEKRRSLISDLKKIIALDSTTKEMPKLLFRLGELYFESSKHYFLEANRKDDDIITANNNKDAVAAEKAKAEREELQKQSKDFARQAVDQYATIVQNYKDFERNDEVLYFLGHNLMEMGDEKRALAAFKRLIDKYPKSKYLPDANLAFGEYYFASSKGKKDMLQRALESYKAAAANTESAVYGFALYKQGWCYYNLGDFQKAMDQFRAVVLYADIAGTKEVEGTPGKGGRQGLVREARSDFVRAFARGGGDPKDAKAEFSKLTKKPDELFTMQKQAANLFYEDGKDKEAALSFNALIAERPLSPDAPGFQGKIVDCVMRAGNKKMTVGQVRRLVTIMDQVQKGGQVKDEKDKKVLDEARELSERTISNLAVSWHNEAKKTKDEETFGLANDVYGDYLTLFPDNPKAYDLRFFWAELLNDNLSKYDRAAEEYTRVFNVDIQRMQKGGEKSEDGQTKPVKPGKYMVNAAYNAILAYDEVVKKAVADGKLKAPSEKDPTKKLEFPPEKKNLLDACERYLKHVPNAEKKVEITYKAARIYYEYNHLDEAIARFADIALKHPDYKFENGDRAGELAANLVLDGYNLMGDWAKVNEWARKFFAEEKLATGAFRVELAKLIEQSAFKLVNQLEAKKDYERAADAYLEFVKEFPKSEIADKALFNASIDYFNAKALDKAIKCRRDLIAHYPKSTFYPQTMFALAEGHEAIAEFAQAAELYETYGANYEKSAGGGKKGGAKKAAPAKKGAKGGKDDKADAAPAGEQKWEEGKAQIALFNAGIFREGLGQYGKAQKNREKYLDLWPDSKDAEAVFLSIVDLHEKAGKYGAAVKQLEEYAKKYGDKDPNKAMTAHNRIAGLYDEKLRNSKSAQKEYAGLLAQYNKLPPAKKKALEIAALDGAARGHFLENEDDWKKFLAIKLKWTRLNAIGELKSSIAQKSKAIGEIQKKYTATVQFKSADPAICALERIGLAYDQFAEALGTISIPKGVPEDYQVEIRAQFEQQAQPLKEKAAEAFAAAVMKSQELDLFNKCTAASLKRLREKYRPDAFPRMDEEVLPVKLEGGGQVVGQDMLAAIQEVPTLTPEQAKAAKQKAKEIGKDVADIRKPTKDDDVAPAPKNADPSPKSAPKKKTQEEPDDSL